MPEKNTVNEARRIIHRIARDRQSGCSELVDESLKAVEIMATLLTRPSTKTVRRARMLTEELMAAQPSMAPLISLAAAVLEVLEQEAPQGRLAFRLQSIVGRWRKGHLETVAYASAELHPILKTAQRIVTYSRSKTILDLFRSFRGTGISCGISISQGSPGMEGITAAAELARAGYEVTLTTDAALFAHLDRADLLLVGADAVLPSGVVNKMGTWALAAAAQGRGLPVYIVCGTDKVLPPHLVSHFEVRQGPPEEIWNPTGDQGLRRPRRLRIENRTFDLTPREFITRIVCPSG